MNLTPTSEECACNGCRDCCQRITRKYHAVIRRLLYVGDGLYDGAAEWMVERAALEEALK